MLCWAARLGLMAKSQEVSSETAFSEPTRSAGSGTWSKKFRARRSRLDAGPNSPQARRASSTFQSRQAAERLEHWSRPAIHLAIQCGHDLMHWLESTIVTSFGSNFVEVASLNGSASRGCATATLQLSSEQTYKSDVRHRRTIGEHQRHGVRLGSLVTLAHCLGNARVLNFSMCAVKVACSLA